jgi:hypothetical protein
MISLSDTSKPRLQSRVSLAIAYVQRMVGSATLYFRENVPVRNSRRACCCLNRS